MNRIMMVLLGFFSFTLYSKYPGLTLQQNLVPAVRAS